MGNFLVHIVSGPEHPTRAALGFLVARTALDQGQDVNVFLAGDAVQLMRDAVLDNLSGLGTGGLREHYDALVGLAQPHDPLAQPAQPPRRCRRGPQVHGRSGQAGGREPLRSRTRGHRGGDEQPGAAWCPVPVRPSWFSFGTRTLS